MRKMAIDDGTCNCKRACADKSSIEDMPQDILIKIVCGVEHGDLKTLFFVSKALRQAASIAKESHFDYTTPKKSRNAFDSEVKCPNAPAIPTRSSRISADDLAAFSLSLFASNDDEEISWAEKICYF